jgi:UDP-N-acetylglucosamine--N-acetylmuramyl-(pentapeptide) pyrophosphoryl-undecaprenol N-acetylglucosamine transferase
MLIAQADLTAERLSSVITGASRDTLAEQAERARALARPRAANEVADICEALASGARA